jgi:hypothetical protein
VTSRKVIVLLAVLGVGSGLILFSPTLALAQRTPASISFNFTSFDYPSAQSTQPLGINNADVIVGYFDAANVTNGFARSPNGIFVEIDYPESSIATLLFGLNDANLAVGFYTDTSFLDQGFQFRYPNQFSSISYPGAADTTPYGINNNGQVVGAWSQGQSQGGFSLTNGVYTSLLYPGAELTYPSAVNSAGVIAGSWVTTCSPLCQYEGFFLSGVGGSYSEIEYPGATMTHVYGLNDSNQVVGAYVDSSGTSHCWAGVPAKNKYINIDYPGSLSCIADGINNKGRITGSYADSNNVTHGFLAVPK